MERKKNSPFHYLWRGFLGTKFVFFGEVGFPCIVDTDEIDDAPHTHAVGVASFLGYHKESSLMGGKVKVGKEGRRR